MCPYIYRCQCKLKKMWKLLETNLQQLKQIRTLGLIANLKKIKKKVMKQPPLGKPYVPFQICINGTIAIH